MTVVLNTLLNCAGRPAPLTDCRVIVAGGKGGNSNTNNGTGKSNNNGNSGFRVLCREGFDGGLPQTFLLEVYEGEALKSKVTNQHPDFEVAHLAQQAGKAADSAVAVLKLYVFARNAKGSSEPFILEETVARMKPGKKHFVEGKHSAATNSF